MNDSTCPVCNSKDIYFFTKKNNFPLYTCKSCKLLFVHPVPTSLDAIYNQEYFSGAQDGYGYTDYDADKEPMIPTFKKYLKLLEMHKSQKGTLLDVGAATGFFMHMAQDDGWKVSGIEYSDFAVQAGKKKGLDIRVGDLRSATFDKNSFDVITLFDVVEHMTDPEADIQSAYGLLKPQGILVINTPDAESLFAKILGKHWHLIVPPEHIHYFSPHNLAILLKRSGFEILEVRKIGKKFTPQYIFKTLHKWTGFSVWDKLSNISQRSFIKYAAVPINLRDNFFMIAQKHEAPQK
jgi:2-polyprenyl-3-methyl-5-hydroxy-6-metoxy-1,4-benzoquinol methylase